MIDRSTEIHTWELGEGSGMFEVDKRRNWEKGVGSEEQLNTRKPREERFQD